MLGLRLNVVVLLAVAYFVGVDSHGMMMEPLNRASRWRVDPTAPANYDDNGLYCGGYSVHYSVYGGKCGVCGDSYGDPTPRPHENGGTFGQGVIVQTYKAGQTAKINVKITKNHKGYFTFDLCPLDNNNKETEQCFKPLKIATGEDRFYLNSEESRDYETSVIIPSDVTCKQCSLRWTYTAGNTWGICDDGTGDLGCGVQETFKNCADIAITK